MKKLFISLTLICLGTVACNNETSQAETRSSGCSVPDADDLPEKSSTAPKKNPSSPQKMPEGLISGDAGGGITALHNSEFKISGGVECEEGSENAEERARQKGIQTGQVPTEAVSSRNKDKRELKDPEEPRGIKRIERPEFGSKIEDPSGAPIGGRTEPVENEPPSPDNNQPRLKQRL